MKKLSSFGRTGGKRNDLRGVSEAVGTVLLLGISVMLAGGIAVWTTQIEEGEEGLYVDLWASVQGTDLVLVHRGGDVLDGEQTYIMITDENGTEVLRNTYSVLSGTSDGTWDPGEELSLDLTGVPDTFDVVVTTVKKSGTPTVILKNTLVKTSAASGFPDLAITQLVLRNTDTQPVTRLNDDGTYIIFIRIDNFGSDMTVPYFTVESDNTVSNVRLFDDMDDLVFSDIQAEQVTISGSLSPSDAGFGTLKNGEYLLLSFTWTRSPTDPRTLGMHTLNAKVVPFFQGEQNYRNNYVERRFRVDKLVKPLPIFGPDPGIYDIYFSNNAPNSGDQVTVTVIIQNSGDQPVNASYGVHLIVSTYRPEIRQSVSGVSYDWRVDEPGFEGQWRDQADSFALHYDDEFPTCVVPNIVLLPGAYFFYYFTLEARVDVPGGQQWVYAAIDVYDSPAHLEGVAIENGDDTSDNFGLGNIQVLPRILVVDDDEATMGTENDMTSSVLESLIGSGVSVDKVYIAQEVEDDGLTRDAPAYDYVQEEIPAPALEDYDIVIWVTGYIEDALTNTQENLPTTYGGNIQELMKYLDSNRYLLIVGKSPVEGLMQYFSGTRVDPNPGNQNPHVSHASFIAASNFLYNYLGILEINIDVDLPIGDTPILKGIDTGEGGLTPPPSGGGDFEIELEPQTAGNGRMELYNPRSEDLSAIGFELPVGMLTTPDRVGTTPTWVNTIRSTSTPDPLSGNASFKATVIGWDIKQIEYLNEKINLIANVLKWFDWEINVGRDMAVTKMELSILTEIPDGSGGTTWDTVPIDEENLPKYLDTILIEATVRNNGPAVESTSVMFYVTGPDGIELPVATGIPDPRTGERETFDNPQDVSSIQGEGGEVTIYKLWLAVGVGSYTFRVVVDPYHLVSEISEENNDITYSTSTVTSFVTQNNILLVDDDSSDDNFNDDPQTQGSMASRVIDYTADGGEPSDIVEQALANLGYDHEVHTVKEVFDGSTWTYDSGLGILDLKRYNSVIWVTGDAGARLGPGDRETLSDNDMSALVSYLDGKYAEAEYLPAQHHENVMFLGKNIILDLALHGTEVYDGTNTVDHFIRNYTGIDPDGVFVEDTSAVLIGPQTGDFIDDIYVGIEYYPDQFTGIFDFVSIPVPASQEDYQHTGIGLYTYGIADRTWYPSSVQFETADSASDNYFRTISHTWQVRYANHGGVETSLYELLYLSLHWFSTPEDQPELLSRNSKISLSDSDPVLGNSYLVEVEVGNIGGVAGGGTVRFMDGGTLIKSENIYLDPDSTTTLEAIWTPLYAGNRTIMIIIDLYDDYDEVFDVINNVPTKSEEVFFFWDDMESGDANWRTDSTQTMINGEGKLNYMEEPTESNIEDQWEDMSGFHLNNEIDNELVEKQFHSSNVSYMMHEPNSEIRKPVDVVFVIDTSGSMRGQKIADARTSAITFVQQLDEHDRAAIYTFNYEDYRFNMAYTYMDEAGKQTAVDIISGLGASGYTPLWDTIGTAINYANSNLESGRTPAIVALTDGDDWGTNGRDTGSETFAPGSDPGTSYLTHTWGKPAGLKWGDATVSFDNSDGASSSHDVRRYTSNSNLAPSWINLGGGSDTRTGLLDAPIYVFTIGLATSPHSSTYVNGGDNPPTHPTMSTTPDNYQFTTEYDLWNVAHQSSLNGNGKGKYYYAPTSSELQDIYDDIFVEIQNLAQQSTRALTTMPEAYWPLDDGVGSTAVDKAGNGHDASLDKHIWVTGKLSGGLYFSSDTRMRVPDSTSLNMMNVEQRTISLWFKADGTSSRQVLYSEGDRDSSSEDGMSIYLYNDRLYAGFWSDQISSNRFLSVPFSDNLNWHHVVFLFDGRGLSQALYLDGVNVDTESEVGYIQYHSEDLVFGYAANILLYHDGTDSGSNHFIGYMDDIWIFNAPLSDSEVTELYETGMVGQHGWRGEYYDNQDFTNLAFIRFDSVINFDWGNGNPGGGMGSNRFSVRWTGYVEPMYTEVYTFYTRTDDGARLYVGGVRIINQWQDQSPTEASGTVSLQAGQRYKVIFEYYENGGGALAELRWSSASQSKIIIPATDVYQEPGTGGTGGGGGGGGGGGYTIDPLNPWSDGSTVNSEKYLETHPIDLRYVDEATMSFYQKYNLKVGSNGGVLLIGTADDPSDPSGSYTYRYIQPNQPYTGNTHVDYWNVNTDDYGTPMRWCWNGKSAGGTMDWEYISVDLSRFSGNWIKVKFLYIYNYGGTGFGWIIDDVEVRVTSYPHSPDKNDTIDNWNLVSTTNYRGEQTTSWYCGDPVNHGGDFKDGLDNSLYTRPIDLTNARTAILDGMFKFNIQEAPGRPPDGFRVEVSADNGESWIPLSLGVRTSWGVSGTETDDEDNIPGDGRSFTGIDSGDNWVHAGSLTRLITNLNGFIGNTIILRFRMVTNTDGRHYEDNDMFKGFYIDDVKIYGESLEGTRADEVLKDYLTLVREHEGAKARDDSQVEMTLNSPPTETSDTPHPFLTGEDAASGGDGLEGGMMLLVIPLLAIIGIAVVSVLVRSSVKGKYG